MFDAATAQLLRSAPGVPGLNPQGIPALLTNHYASLVSARLRGDTELPGAAETEWPLERIADTYELITSIHTDTALRKASAFVAATAQQILARRQVGAGDERAITPNINRDRVDPAIAAALLFLAAEQYADANEAASTILTRRDGQLYEATILCENIADLARGQLGQIVDRGQRWRTARISHDLEERALAALLETLITGLELLAVRFLGLPAPERSAGGFDHARAAFTRVLELSAELDGAHKGALGGAVVFAYAGPHHLASLLLAAIDGIEIAALTSVPPPDGADAEIWEQWLRFRASKFPFVWPNHRDAIAHEFHETGKSSVVVLPTGAGKTTVSSLKIAGVLARGKKVVFLAPTHALVEQLTEDLQDMFPRDLFGSVVSSDFDLLFQTDAKLREIEVMTPERCLQMLSFARESFSEVGLLVFDECHLLSPQSGKIRRAIDGMLCLLGFNHIAPDADLLFLSAMLKNGADFGDWVRELTGRPCVCVDLLWKPSRQARGVVIYRQEELDAAKTAAAAAQSAEDKRKGKRAKGLRAAASRKLVVRPWAIWGLQHNWLNSKKAICAKRQILDEAVLLTGDNEFRPIHLKPNANHVAVRLATAAATHGLKTIVFVNTKNDAVSTARDISAKIELKIDTSDAEKVRWDALRAELGDLKHSLLTGPAAAVPHNSSMLRLERDLAERLFKRSSGAMVIVATPTLAQGLNLPAHLAILAGDKRADAAQKGREDLEAHEILNAAARAGRAGHLANGVVLLIPEPIISFTDGKGLSRDVLAKLKSILPEDDRCVIISDPLEIVLDRVMEGRALDADVRYIINRMAALREADGLEEPTHLFNLGKSYGAFGARKRSEGEIFEAKVTALKAAIALDRPGEVDNTIAALASQSGLSMDLLLRLKKRVADGAGSLPTTVIEWLIWTVNWLKEDDAARVALMHDVKRAVLGACGGKKDDELTAKELQLILPGLIAWIEGKPLAVVERELGGDPDSDSPNKQVCPRARELVGTVLQRGFSFIMGLVSHVIEDADPFGAQEALSRQLVECLGAAVRRGFDSPEKISFANENPGILSRVQVHEQYEIFS